MTKIKMFSRSEVPLAVSYPGISRWCLTRKRDSLVRQPQVARAVLSFPVMDIAHSYRQSRAHFFSLQLIILCAVAASGQGCTSVQPLAGMVEPALLEYSDERRTVRAEVAAVPLEQRIEAVEADLVETLVRVGEGALAPRHIAHDGRKGVVHLETNAAVLSALAAKYGVTRDDETRQLAARIVKGIMGLDALSGELDGFIPRYANARSLQPTDVTTHANAYTQLLFAYAMADRHIGPSDDIRQHVSLIYQKFVEDDFALRHRDGSYVSKANVRNGFITLNARRAFDRRLLDEAAFQLGDEQTRELVQAHRWRGKLLGPRYARFFAVELPTTSSSWLNLQALVGLSLLDEPYDHEVVRLANRYRRDNNPFFRTLSGLHGGEEDLTAIRARLEEFPYPATSSGIINSHRDDLAMAPRNYIKFSAVPESREPLPLYEVRSSTYLWKRSLREIDSMPEERPETLLGHDLLQAYWFYRLLESGPESVRNH